ncbi:restriction endonuclease [Flaviflexus ciconiae]|uniref:Restriction endonuclease n=1 Tax=Flaviflexus ciconiae TaxID=2496867 RepID=A0A3Q9G443_9ACTO|nr:NaeI family type II restriction endonuclease [Flaviflexus ciconiae]AZQ77087.1 restriction endonuclease [Flaviflexus ciconiae]
MSEDANGDEQPDEEVQEVASFILSQDPDGKRMARVFRDTFDQLYDGQRTGRFRIDQLMKTEKAHFGSLIEINLQRELKFLDGDKLDYKIADHEVDSKYSHTGAWMLPGESFDEIVLVSVADDKNAIWSVGLVRVTKENRRSSANRDRKTSLNQLGRSRILWLFRDQPMQPNALQLLSPEAVRAIMDPRKSGQARINELFRQATNVRLSRNIIATVGQQSDYMKRVRYNGGARSALRPEGHIILGGDYRAQTNIAQGLGATVPEPGEFVSVQVVPADPHNGSLIDGSWWRLKNDDDRITVDAPIIR